MMKTLPLPHSHINFAHTCWKTFINHDALVIDATCGNGRDTLFLARHSPAKIYAMDIQKEAIESTKKRLEDYLPEKTLSTIHFVHGCHSTFPEEIKSESAALIVYNLGYFPSGDKSKTTMTGSTLKSVESSLSIVKPGGMISITCYPGHPEGANEEKALIDFVENLPSDKWRCRCFQHKDKNSAPSLLLIEKLYTVPI